MPRSRIIRTILALALAYAVLGGWLTLPENAHGYIDYDTVSVITDTVAIVDVGDTLGSPGTGVPVTIFLDDYYIPIQGFTISITLSRPDLMEFVSQTIIDTCYDCVDSACTQVDTSLCTVDVVPSTVQNTLIQNWDHSEARTFGGTNILLSGIADVDFDESPQPIQPFGPSSALIKVIAQVNCEIPDTLQNRVVLLDINPPQSYLTDPDGNSAPSYIITDNDTTFNGADTTVHLSFYHPVLTLVNGSVTVPFSVKGDMNRDGQFTVLDVVALIGVAFRGNPPPCPASVADVNCTGDVTILDVVLLINHAFRGGPQPIC